MIIKPLAIAAVALFATAAHGMTIQQAAHMPVQHVAEVHGVAGESLDAFLQKVGVQLRAFSDSTGFEACAEVAKNAAGVYGVAITTSRSHVGCIVHGEILPAGMQSIGVTIHSHGTDRTASMNKADRALLGLSDGGNLHITGQDINHFSDTDYAGGAGYLATPAGVIFQNGKGTEHTI